MSEHVQVVENNPEGVSDAMLARLRAVPILSSVPEQEIHCLRDAREVRLADGEFIARQGDVAHSFWILLSGEMRIYQTLPDGRESILATAPAGTALGELPLLSNTAYAASVRATEPCDLLQFDEQQFWNMMKRLAMFARPSSGTWPIASRSSRAW